jgi:ribonuclease HI
MKQITIFCDGLTEPTNPDGFGCCAFIAFEGDVSGTRGAERPTPLHQAWACIARPGEGITNNVCEYRAVRAALRWLEQYDGEAHADIFTDSNLVVQQVNGAWDCHAKHLIPFRNECQNLLRDLPNASLRWVRRDENDVADALTRIAYEEARRKVA